MNTPHEKSIVQHDNAISEALCMNDHFRLKELLNLFGAHHQSAQFAAAVMTRLMLEYDRGQAGRLRVVECAPPGQTSGGHKV